MESPPKPPLITPSASPPTSRISYRMADSTPPVKRQRLFSTPRRTIPETPSSSASRPQSPLDVQKEREASQLRLFDVWSSLAERYTRRIDEDDIVDIRTGEITKDNGFLRNFRSVKFGAIAAPTAGDITADEYSDTPEDEEEDEYDLDELDAFAEENPETIESEGGDLDAEDLGRGMPLATPLGPADAEDLRGFMDAERRRKELYGSDVEDDDDDVYTSEDEHSDRRSECGSATSLEEQNHPLLEDVEEGGYSHAEEEEEEEGVKEGPPEILDQPVPIDLSSEDELDNWDVDEASMVHPVIKSEQVEDDNDNDSDIEFIEPPIITASSTSRSKAAEPHPYLQKTPTKSYSKSRSSPKPVRQLYTPPQSQTSSCPSATPTSDRFFDFSRDSPVAAPSPNKAKSHSSVTTDIKSDPSSSHFGNVGETPVKLDLKQATKPQSSRVSPAKAPRLKPVVLLTPRKRFDPPKAFSSPDPVPRDFEESRITEHDNPTATMTSKGKGKVKEPEVITKSKSVSPEYQHNRRNPVPRNKKRGNPRNRNSPELIQVSDDPITIVFSPSKASRSVAPEEEEYNTFFTRAPSTSRKSNIYKTLVPETETSFSVSRDDTPVTRLRQSKSPTPELRPLSRKRKRVGSDVEHGSDGSTSGVKRASPEKPDPSSNHASTSRLVAEDRPETRQQKKRSSPRRRPTSESESGTENDDDSSGSERHNDSYRHKSRSRTYTLPPPPPHYSYPHAPYPHSQHPSQTYPPIPDPRAQFIINQAMQQLSALVGASWIPPHHYGDGSIPQTPVHRHHSGRPDPFITPTHHPHPYPYIYDPNLSHATLPPDSPDFDSSPDKPNSGRRKSLVRRSRSRGRHVSFKDEQERLDGADGHSSAPSMRPSKAGSQKERPRGDGNRGNEGHKKSKGKRKESTPDRKYQSENDAASDADRGYTRAQTPGPSTGPSPSNKAGRGQASSSNQRGKR